MVPSACIPWVSPPAISPACIPGQLPGLAFHITMASLPQTLDVCGDRLDVCRGHGMEASHRWQMLPPRQ